MSVARKKSIYARWNTVVTVDRRDEKVGEKKKKKKTFFAKFNPPRLRGRIKYDKLG